MTSGPAQPPEQPAEDPSHTPGPYPSPGAPEPETPTPAPASERRGLRDNLRDNIVILTLTVLAVALTVVSFFLSYFRQTMSPSGPGEELHIKDTPWREVYEPEIPPEQAALLEEQHPAWYGIPLSVALAVLLVSLIVRVVLMWRPHPVFTNITRMTAVIGGTALVMTFFTLAMDVVAKLSYNTAATSSVGGIDVSYTVDPGFWVMFAAGVVGLMLCLLAAFMPGAHHHTRPGPGDIGDTGEQSGTLDTA